MLVFHVIQHSVCIVEECLEDWSLCAGVSPLDGRGQWRKLFPPVSGPVLAHLASGCQAVLCSCHGYHANTFDAGELKLGEREF